MIIAFDSEATYENGRDIKALGATNYIRHPNTDHYLASFWCPEWSWVGHPSQAPWERVQGHSLVSHNRSYDLRVAQHTAPPLKLEGWHCTADLAAFLQSPRALKYAAKQLLGVEMSKDVRDRSKGKPGAELGASQEVRDYALKDAEVCWHLWNEYGHLMPDSERKLSMHTTGLAVNGIGLDLEALEKGTQILQEELHAVEAQIPWAKEEDVAVTSPRALARECRKLGIEPPESTDHKSEEFETWASKYADHIPMVASVQKWRSINRTLAVLEAMTTRSCDGVLPVELKYFGACLTGRWSGSGGLNLQNLTKKPVCGVDCRSMLAPRNGKKFIIADFSTIEPRVLFWLAEDFGMLEKLHGSLDIYEVAARRSGIYRDEQPMKIGNPQLRQFQKCVTLGCGFGMGAERFKRMVKLWIGKDITTAQAQGTVDQYRRSNPKIVALWHRLDRSARRDRQFEMALPSGRVLRYFDLQTLDGDLSGRLERGAARRKLWGGHFTENATQALAREILAAAILRLEEAGLPVVLSVHDEVVVEASADALPEVVRLMEITPEWVPGLPVKVEATVKDRYEK